MECKRCSVSAGAALGVAEPDQVIRAECLFFSQAVEIMLGIASLPKMLVRLVVRFLTNSQLVSAKMQ